MVSKSGDIQKHLFDVGQMKDFRISAINKKYQIKYLSNFLLDFLQKNVNVNTAVYWLLNHTVCKPYI